MARLAPALRVMLVVCSWWWWVLVVVVVTPLPFCIAKRNTKVIRDLPEIE
jgi:cytochrome c biogenesis protein ResB